MRLKSLSTIGSLPFFDLLRMLLASFRSTPWGAVTRSVDMTAVTGSLTLSWNWMSRGVMIPMSLERSLPSSASLC